MSLIQAFLNHARMATVLVTGASGFVGSHVVKHLVAEGYQVRAAARGARAQYMKENCGAFGNKLQVVEVNDLASDDLSQALNGVDAVMHIATPIPGKVALQEMIDGAIDGSLNIVRQAEKAGVKRIVMTGSIAAVKNPQDTYQNTDWNPITKEEALASNDTFNAYCASKKYAELAVWEFADAHPDIDITIISPPWVFGPVVRELYPTASNPDFTSSNSVLYTLLKPDGGYPIFPFYVDVRDLAKAHVLALKAPHTTTIGRKRLILGSPHDLDFKETLKLFAEKRPVLVPRLTKKEPAVYPMGVLPCDFDRINAVLGMKKEDFLPLEKTLLDTIDDYLELERQWGNLNKA